MIVKPYKECIMLKKLNALCRRLEEGHPKRNYVMNDYSKKIAEKKGEESIHFMLDFLDKSVFSKLYSVRIPDENGYFQMDVVLITANFILILEVKNWYGTILFSHNNQVIRVGYNDVEEGFPNPVSQLHLQKIRLRQWLNKNGYEDIPVYGKVVISSANTILKSANPSITVPEEIIHSNQINLMVNDLLVTNTKQIVADKKIKLLCNQILKEHTPLNKDVLSTYKIKTHELIKGVICDKCQEAVMSREFNKWQCENCDFISKHSHKLAINDYRLLIKNVVKNKDVREFLQIESSSLMKRLLKNGGFPYKGNTSARVYDLIQ